MGRTILHIDFNSYFATVEQQANPRLRGKPVGVTGGDRMKRTVIGAASVEAKKFGIKTGMPLWQARSLCPELILVPGDSDKYLEITKRFLNILKDYSPYMEVFSIDEVFMEIVESETSSEILQLSLDKSFDPEVLRTEGLGIAQDDNLTSVILNEVKNLSRMRIIKIAQEVRLRIQKELGEVVTCSIGISYNKLMAKLAGSLYKPDGLVVIADEEAARWILDRVDLDSLCGIGPRVKRRLNNMGIFNFKELRKVPLEILLASFKSYGQILYNMSRGIDESPLIPFYEKEEVKSIGHRHTISYDTNNPEEIKQILLKLTELVARRLRAKKLVGQTVRCWYRQALNPTSHRIPTSEVGVRLHLGFDGDGMQITIPHSCDGLEIFKAAWKIFTQIWDGNKIRMIGVSVSNLKPALPTTINFLPEENRTELINKILDEVNQKYGEFTLQRGVLLGSQLVKRKPNPFLSDRRFKL